MGSKWIDKDLFNQYVNEKENEIDTQNQGGMLRSEYVWPTPPSGTMTKPKVYEGRLLSDPEGLFTKRYFYHMWKSGDKMNYYLCPKTEGFEIWCPLCEITKRLYTGTENDKKTAFQIKRKERHITNFYIVDDPRDSEIDDESKKHGGKVKIYEFPSKLESKIKQEVIDKKQGLGLSIFDPGEEGYNLIIKIGRTKPDKNGNDYPDYSDSLFARRTSAIGTDKEIKEIMENRYSLKEYLDNQKMSDERVEKLLKDERLFEIIEDDWNKIKGKSNENSKKVENDKKEDDVPDFSNESSDSSSNTDSSSDDNSYEESDILKELEKELEEMS